LFFSTASQLQWEAIAILAPSMRCIDDSPLAILLIEEKHKQPPTHFTRPS
jgi:hypothetical protein